MVGSYDIQLVGLSLVVAIVASYTALELAGRVSEKHGTVWSWAWLVGGAIAMGTGIWSMHFIGMLAFHLPVPIAYDPGITMLSMAIAIAVSGIALFVVRRPILSGQNITIGATLMGVGICAMHYTGMYAMRMSPPIVYHPPLFIASVIIAIVASLAALWIAFQLRHQHSGFAVLAKLGSATIMGLAITGMHYTGMAAAQFAPDSVCLAVGIHGGLGTHALAATIGITTITILAITIGVSALDAHAAAHTARMADSLQFANEQLRNLALNDRLTGLPNRTLLEDRMAQALARAQRSKESFALMFVDLDNFKPVNDTHGHRIGDDLLKAVAKRLTGSVRKSDTVARTGGDEFVIVLHELQGTPDAAMVGRKILDELTRPFFIEGRELAISCSIGISVYPENGKTVAMLLANADTAMYHAKRGGRNNFRFFDPEMIAQTQQASV
jgi:diguanylate cyclase